MGMATETPGTTIHVTREVGARQELYVRQTSGLVRTVGPRTALIANLVGMGIIVNFFWIVFSSAGYPNASLPETVAIGVLINVGVGYVYWMLSSAMPRSGGDYVFVGRIFHPSIGFGVNLLFTVVFVSWAGFFAFYTAIYGLPIMLASYTIAGGSSTALSWATALSTSTTDQLVVGAVVLLIVVLVSFLPTRWIFRTAIGIFAISGIIYLIMIGVMAATPQSVFASDWNAYAGNPSYRSLIASLPASTYVITGTGTFLGIVYTMLSFIGYANTAYFGGEIRGNPTRTQGLAIFGAPFIFAALIGLLYAMTYYTFGHDFLVALSTTYVTTGGPTPAFPATMLLSAYIVKNPLLAGFLGFGVPITFFGFSLVYFIIPTRNLFAWSFDRILPTFFARVTRNGVPWVAVSTLVVASAISLYVAVYTTLFNYLTYANFGFWIGIGLVCLAGALFPFLRKNMFESAPKWVRARVGPIPILTIVGIASALASWFVSYATSTAQFLGTSLNYLDLFFLVIVLVVGLVGYFVAWAVQHYRGVPVELISRQLPPE